MQRRSQMFLLAAVAVIFLIFAIARLGELQSAAAQKKHVTSQDAWLRGVSDGSTRVVDMTYAINDKLPAWPGDDRTFEGKTVATPEKDGYFARSFWTLEHYGTRPLIFPVASNISIRFLWLIFSVRRWCSMCTMKSARIRTIACE